MEAASNTAISASQSKYVVIHDDDDTWERPIFFQEPYTTWTTSPTTPSQDVLSSRFASSNRLMATESSRYRGTTTIPGLIGNPLANRIGRGHHSAQLVYL